ncbi:MAG TPA: threonine synthase, partial [Rhizomicrobium sp.]|nr:threonine synthase [Rhizomicrobium sp.]
MSTRGQAPRAGFADVLLAGLAPDGGLYLPESWPRFSALEIAGLRRRASDDYDGIATDILARFTGDAFTRSELHADVAAAYAGFDDSLIVPIRAIAPGLYILELFHGPTLAFKDLALQVLGRLFARALARRGGRATVVVATSGDTGSAAIAALGGLPNIDVFVLHPKDRVSEVQRRQMTTAPHANVHNIALEGTFDDAQALVKALFADAPFAQDVSLTAVNSINFVRIAVQAVYYFAAAQIGGSPVFVVPTGNFGDVFAGEAAMRMGLDIEKLVVATNANDILARALNDGVYERRSVRASLSPSMDIQVASNFERALFEAAGRDAGWLRQAMTDFARDGRLVIPPRVLAALRERYAAFACDDARTIETMALAKRDFGETIDPHTAVALAAALPWWEPRERNVVVLSTAHPAKFPDAVARATGAPPPLPDRLKGLFERPERLEIL